MRLAWLTSIALAALAACAPAQAVQRVTYPDGAPHWEYQLRDELPDGTGRVWYPNGPLRSEGTYRHGEKHGRFRFYTSSGTFEHQALFIHHAEVWSSADAHAEPPAALVAQLGDTLPAAQPYDAIPSAYFAMLDQPSGVPRLAVEAGLTSLRRTAGFASVALGDYGAYGQLLQTDLDSDTHIPYAGRETAELGATRRVKIMQRDDVVVRAGMVFPMRHDDAAGAVGATTAAGVNPADIGASFIASSALRTSASVIHRQDYLVAEGDAGIDWVFGDETRPLDPVARANVGIGVGLRAVMLSVQLANAVLAADPARHVSAAGLELLLWTHGLWCTATASTSFSGTQQLAIGVGFDL